MVVAVQTLIGLATWPRSASCHDDLLLLDAAVMLGIHCTHRAQCAAYCLSLPGKHNSLLVYATPLVARSPLDTTLIIGVISVYNGQEQKGQAEAARGAEA